VLCYNLSKLPTVTASHVIIHHRLRNTGGKHALLIMLLIVGPKCTLAMSQSAPW